VHPNTVGYRVRQAEAVLGLGGRGWVQRRYELETALRLRKFVL
jgi:DNA-binding PucR family transcriptional regulator